MILDYPICRVVFHVEKLKRVPSCIVGESAITFSIPLPPFFLPLFFLFFFSFSLFFLPGDRNYGRGNPGCAQTMLESAASLSQSVGR